MKSLVHDVGKTATIKMRRRISRNGDGESERTVRRQKLGHPRAQRGTELPKGRDSEEELLEAAMTRAREEEDEFFHTVLLVCRAACLLLRTVVTFLGQ